MTGKAVFSHWRMLPQHWTAFVRVALITKLIGVAGLKHLASFTTVRIVTGGARHFHARRLTRRYLPPVRPVLSAEEMGGPLEEGLSLIDVTTETSFLNRRGDQ